MCGTGCGIALFVTVSVMLNYYINSHINLAYYVPSFV